MNDKDIRIILLFILNMFYLLFATFSGVSGQLFPTIAFGGCAILISLVFACEILEDEE